MIKTNHNNLRNPGIEAISIPRECKALNRFSKIEAESCRWLSDASQTHTVMGFE